MRALAMNLCLGTAGLMAVAAGVARGQAVEFFNETDNGPFFNPNSFQVTFKGSVAIPPQPFPDAAINPFGSPLPISVSGVGGNTVVTFTGNSWPYPGGASVHFGLVESNGTAPVLQVLDKKFIGNGSNPQILDVTAPTIAPKVAQSGAGPQDYAVLLVQAQAPGVPSSSTTTWQEISFAQGQPTDVTLSNFSATSFVVTDARYFISPTEIPLDDLNFTLLPPTDPRFAPLTKVDGVQLDPGASIELVPEPASLVLLAAGLVGLAARKAHGAFAPRDGRP